MQSEKFHTQMEDIVRLQTSNSSKYARCYFYRPTGIVITKLDIYSIFLNHIAAKKNYKKLNNEK